MVFNWFGKRVVKKLAAVDFLQLPWWSGCWLPSGRDIASQVAGMLLLLWLGRWLSGGLWCGMQVVGGVGGAGGVPAVQVGLPMLQLECLWGRWGATLVLFLAFLGDFRANVARNPLYAPSACNIGTTHCTPALAPRTHTAATYPHCSNVPALAPSPQHAPSKQKKDGFFRIRPSLCLSSSAVQGGGQLLGFLGAGFLAFLRGWL